jgi:hypothetical protein
MNGIPRRRDAFLDAARVYAGSRIPTHNATHELCVQLVEMLAHDRGERVVLQIGPVVIARDGSSAMLSGTSR